VGAFSVLRKQFRYCRINFCTAELGCVLQNHFLYSRDNFFTM
jgi:hypothetical protein